MFIDITEEHSYFLLPELLLPEDEDHIAAVRNCLYISLQRDISFDAQYVLVITNIGHTFLILKIIKQQRK